MAFIKYNQTFVVLAFRRLTFCVSLLPTILTKPGDRTSRVILTGVTTVFPIHVCKWMCYWAEYYTHKICQLIQLNISYLNFLYEKSYMEIFVAVKDHTAHILLTFTYTHFYLLRLSFAFFSTPCRIS